MNKKYKIIIGLAVFLVVVLGAYIVWDKFLKEPVYYALYLRTGDVYFGQLTRFPHFGLKGVYFIQVNSQNQQNPVSIQKFSNIFWGPQDFMRINRSDVVWMTKLKNDGQLAKVITANPDLNAPPASTSPVAPVPAPVPNPAGK
jgi:hypothetical protein